MVALEHPPPCSSLVSLFMPIELVVTTGPSDGAAVSTSILSSCFKSSCVNVCGDSGAGHLSPHDSSSVSSLVAAPMTSAAGTSLILLLSGPAGILRGLKSRVACRPGPSYQPPGGPLFFLLLTALACFFAAALAALFAACSSCFSFALSSVCMSLGPAEGSFAHQPHRS